MSEKLAILGGPKAVTSQKIGWPNFDEKTIKAVENVLRSGKVNYWTGPKGMEFEKKFAEWQEANMPFLLQQGPQHCMSG
jgi:dTDP-4-amino-4,6-dideoxygalactose transaminase